MGNKIKSIIKNVRFQNEPKIYHMFVWNFAYKNARKSDWGTRAVDRIRFEDRISRLSQILDVILEHNHRCLIYNNRFLE